MIKNRDEKQVIALLMNYMLNDKDLKPTTIASRNAEASVIGLRQQASWFINRIVEFKLIAEILKMCMLGKLKFEKEIKRVTFKIFSKLILKFKIFV